MSTHKYLFQYKIEYHPNLSKICSYEFFSKSLKNEFDTAVYIPALPETVNVSIKFQTEQGVQW